MFSIKRTFTFATIIAMLIATAVIASFNPMVVTGDSTLRYGGPITPDDYEWQPEVYFDPQNGSFLDNGELEIFGNLTIKLTVREGKSGNGFFVDLKKISYKTSWQNTSTIIYENPYVNRGILVPSEVVTGPDWFYYDLGFTDIPEGSQKIEVTAVKDGIYPDFHAGIYHTFSISRSKSLGLLSVRSTVEPAEPFPTALIAVVILVSAVVVGAGLLLYFKKRKR